jgi:hypothetical protein
MGHNHLSNRLVETYSHVAPEIEHRLLNPGMCSPASLTAAATLACLQAGLTSVTTILVLAGAGSEGGQAAFQVPVGVAQAAGVALLIMGAWRLMRGRGRSMLTPISPPEPV